MDAATGERKKTPVFDYNRSDRRRVDDDLGDWKFVLEDEVVLAAEEHFGYVQQLSVRHGWVAAFRYDIAVRTDVMVNHINGAPGDPSVKREEFLEDALARTNLLRDGRIMKYDNRKLIRL